MPGNAVRCTVPWKIEGQRLLGLSLALWRNHAKELSLKSHPDLPTPSPARRDARSHGKGCCSAPWICQLWSRYAGRLQRRCCINRNLSSLFAAILLNSSNRCWKVPRSHSSNWLLAPRGSLRIHWETISAADSLHAPRGSPVLKRAGSVITDGRRIITITVPGFEHRSPPISASPSASEATRKNVKHERGTPQYHMHSSAERWEQPVALPEYTTTTHTTDLTHEHVSPRNLTIIPNVVIAATATNSRLKGEGFLPESIVIVTARSLPQLFNLGLKDCIEMPELEEDDARSLLLYHAAPGPYLKNADKVGEQLMKQSIERCYFRKGDDINYHYHPLALKVLGGQLGNDPSEWTKKLNELDPFNQYQEDEKDHPIFSILRNSFELLKQEDQLLFMDVAIYFPEFCEFYAPQVCSWARCNIFGWLSMVHGKSLDGIKQRLQGLKSKSLLENLGDWK